jgi:hypothetical protein
MAPRFAKPRLQLNQRPGQARFGAIEEKSHAQGLSALRSNQTHLPTDVIDVLEHADLGFVVCGAAFQAANPIFHRLTELRADLEAFLNGAFDVHAGYPKACAFRGRRILCRCGLKIFTSLPILAKAQIPR